MTKKQSIREEVKERFPIRRELQELERDWMRKEVAHIMGLWIDGLITSEEVDKRLVENHILITKFVIKI